MLHTSVIPILDVLKKVNRLSYTGLFQNISPDPREDREQGNAVRNCLLCFFQEDRRREGEEERERGEIKTTWERKVKEDGGPEGQLGP